MALLVFNMTYPEKKWDIYLNEVFGEKIASNFKIEANATAKKFEATVRLLNFSGDKNILSKLKNDKFIETAYVTSERKSTQIL